MDGSIISQNQDKNLDWFGEEKDKESPSYKLEKSQEN